VEFAALGLDAAPLDGIAVGVRSDPAQELEVRLPPPAMPGPLAASRGARLQPAGALPLCPVVGDSALDLVGRSGRAPEKRDGRPLSIRSEDAGSGLRTRPGAFYGVSSVA